MHRSSILNVDARIQQSVVANLSARPQPVEAGPFVIGFDPSTTSPNVNYATPRPGLPITPADVAALVKAFRTAGRTPRLEYVTSCAPGLEALLTEARFTVEARHDYLVCTPGTLMAQPVPEDFTIADPSTPEQYAALISAQNEAFGGEPTATGADVARIQHLQSRGGIAVMAVTASGDCAGGGQAVPPHDGVGEVAGIAVRAPYRRRGLAGAITAGVTARLFAGGADLAWLEASGEDSWRVYERVGYRLAGKRLYLVLD
jgi:ribosomal protein S18 acetylase RimI-like enzyme